MAELSEESHSLKEVCPAQLRFTLDLFDSKCLCFSYLILFVLLLSSNFIHRKVERLLWRSMRPILCLVDFKLLLFLNFVIFLNDLAWLTQLFDYLECSAELLANCDEVVLTNSIGCVSKLVVWCEHYHRVVRVLVDGFKLTLLESTSSLLSVRIDLHLYRLSPTALSILLEELV